jgi:hypothetical protein
MVAGTERTGRQAEKDEKNQLEAAHIFNIRDGIVPGRCRQDSTRSRDRTKRKLMMAPFDSAQGAIAGGGVGHFAIRQNQNPVGGKQGSRNTLAPF